MVMVVADISGNHNGNRYAACKLIYQAAMAGCDYVKFQLYRPEDMPDANQGNNREIYERLRVPEDWLPVLFQQAKECGIPLFASVFSVWAVDLLLKFDTPFIKIASPGSTKLSHKTYKEIFKAIPAGVQTIASMGPIPYHPLLNCHPNYILYCPPGHPHKIQDYDITRFNAGLDFQGFSDHSAGCSNAITMIEQGAMIIEKHIKLEHDNDCIDAAFSGDYKTFKQICRIAH